MNRWREKDSSSMDITLENGVQGDNPSRLPLGGGKGEDSEQVRRVKLILCHQWAETNRQSGDFMLWPADRDGNRGHGNQPGSHSALNFTAG